MPPILISGSNGFIGSHVTAELRRRGAPFTTIARDAWHTQSAEAGAALLHLANIHGDASANLRLTLDVLRFAREHAVRSLIFVQSFASLTGPGSFNPGEINCGFRTRFVDPYTGGKLAAENYIVRHAPKGIGITFVYLPVVLGAGGSWNLLFSQLAQYRKLVIPLVATARANHIDVAAVVERFADLLAARDENDSHPRRLIWVSEDSRRVAWPDFLKEQVRPAPQIETFLPWLPFSDSPLKHAACALASAATLPDFARKLAFSSGGNAGVREPASYDIWEPGPFLRFLMCEQSYIAPFSPAP